MPSMQIVSVQNNLHLNLVTNKHTYYMYFATMLLLSQYFSEHVVLTVISFCIEILGSSAIQVM